MSATTDETTSFNTATCSNNTTNQDPNVVEEMQTNILFLNSEIQTLKSTLIELQTYTMSVNKKLLENQTTETKKSPFDPLPPFHLASNVIL